MTHLESRDALVSLRKVSKEYVWGESTLMAVDSVDLEIRNGDFVSIVGPSGSGKTTLLNLIGCLTAPTSGEILVKGINVRDLNDSQMSRLRNSTVGFVFQGYNLIPTLDALENVTLPVLFSKHEISEEDIWRASDQLTKFGLGNRLSHYPTMLSMGEQQRVAIARALMNEPKLIIADEPTGALDSQRAKEVSDILRDLNKEGRAVVLATHDPRVGGIASIRYQIEDGRLHELSL